MAEKNRPSLAYDQHAFSKRVKVTGKHTGLTWNDFTGTTVKKVRAKPLRWLNAWSGNPNHIRLVVGVMVWGCATGTHGPFPREEFDAAPLKFVQHYENKCRDNASLLNNRPGKGEQQLRERDTQRRVGIFGYAKLLTMAIHMSYGLGYTSAQISDALSVRITPTAVRQWLHRCNMIARTLWPELCAAKHWSNQGKSKRLISGGQRGGGKGPRRPDLVVKVVELHDRGLKCHEIAKALGWKYSAVKYQLDARGLWNPKQSRPRVNPAVYQEARVWIRAGVHIIEVAPALGLNRATLYSWWYKKGKKQ